MAAIVRVAGDGQLEAAAEFAVALAQGILTCAAADLRRQSTVLLERVGGLVDLGKAALVAATMKRWQ